MLARFITLRFLDLIGSSVRSQKWRKSLELEYNHPILFLPFRASSNISHQLSIHPHKLKKIFENVTPRR
jgi:hypothetical protein